MMLGLLTELLRLAFIDLTAMGLTLEFREFTGFESGFEKWNLPLLLVKYLLFLDVIWESFVGVTLYEVRLL